MRAMQCDDCGREFESCADEFAALFGDGVETEHVCDSCYGARRCHIATREPHGAYYDDDPVVTTAGIISRELYEELNRHRF